MNVPGDAEAGHSRIEHEGPEAGTQLMLDRTAESPLAKQAKKNVREEHGPWAGPHQVVSSELL